eukprot:gb/GFBE01050273.1/.p1 GENE.gb/GFBE01050273.1/~~gb/GFBE01050273.1/.p1  ORF type:complete len:1006 (+),score=225.91 gb/GFBE01050273.1/:1-3018(+)
MAGPADRQLGQDSPHEITTPDVGGEALKDGQRQSFASTSSLESRSSEPGQRASFTSFSSPTPDDKDKAEHVEKPTFRISQVSALPTKPTHVPRAQRMLLKQEKERKMRKARCLRSLAVCMDGPYMTALSVSLTFWALLGDDLRILTTDKPADQWFNIVTIVCLFFFTVEVVLSSLCKQDYFLGFFFSLDCISTASLVLDLTWVADTLVSDDMAMGEQARSGRTARLGASIGRVVRVLRLIRIVKLYKAMYEKMMAQKDKKTGPGTDEDDWDNLDVEVDKDSSQDEGRESAVGKKLVAITTRRVILLVLAMLLCMPAFSVTNSHNMMSSASFGADDVFEYFRRMKAGSINQTLYEESLLKYFYYHNWFVGNSGCQTEEQSCPAMFYAHTFWVGFAGRDVTDSDLLTLTSEARIRPSVLTAFDSQSKGAWDDANSVYVTGEIPEQVHKRLTGEWDIKCEYGGWLHMGTSLLADSIQDTVNYQVRCPDDLRPQERFTVRPSLITQDQFDSWHLAFFFDSRPFVKLESQNNMMLTFFICIVLTVASMQFSKDSNVLVLQPVESMIAKVNAIRDNPLAAMKIADDEFKGEEIKKHRQNAKSPLESALTRYHLGFLFRCSRAFMQWWSGSKGGSDAMMETAVLEKTIIKLGSLLALGFGEAGASIVADNMKGLDSAGVNAMVPGARVDCIIGSARIRDFSTATEVLQGKVMTFVNQIAEIVHGLVNEFHGAPNKNSGDRFLLIWRLGGLTADQQTRLADMAMVAFVRILGCCHNNKILADYRTHPGLIQRLGANCRVNLSFGLHSGWAIEGAVGSEFKIDASYLSPNVSIAESLEAATKVYNVSIIASDACISRCSKALSSKCRLVDKVQMKGSKVPLNIFVFDLDPLSLHVREFSTKIEWNVRQRFKARQILEVAKQKKWSGEVDIVKEYVDDSVDVMAMRKAFTTEFMQLFNMGYQNYSQGEWVVARRLLKETQVMLGFQDGPSGALLSFMETPYQFEAPPKWAGVRSI